jgi:hypothetical protein
MSHAQTYLVCCFVALATLATRSLDAADPNSVEFFESRIRPVLVQQCYQCHSAEADEIGGSLLLDSSNGMMTGGDSGPAITPGDVDTSLLISAIRYDSSEMPPSGKLPDHVIEDFEKWIASGAVDPRTAVGQLPVRSRVDLEEGRKFWAFRPLRQTPPEHTDLAAADLVDHFLNERLEQAGIEPNRLASPAIQLRRLAFDLTGLPPDLELQKQWLADPSPAHWSRIVDRMLASPEFAAHWARHWMDVARYADSNGSDFNATFHDAWRYRDYLIESFATDRPFDEMVRQQIAGDLLPANDNKQRHDNLVATTFLMLGTKMLSERDKDKLTLDVVDDQIDTIGRAFMGLTLGCARCHDHKFDPVPIEDYYALAGIFKSTVSLKGESQKYVSTWNKVPLPTSDEHLAAINAHEAAMRSLQSQIQSAEGHLKTLQSKSEPDTQGVTVDDSEATKTGPWKSSDFFKSFVGVGYIHDDNGSKGNCTIRFATRLPKSGSYEVRIAYSPGSSRASAVPVTIETSSETVTTTLDQRTVRIEPMWASLGTFDFANDKDATVTLTNQGTSGYVIADAVQFIPIEMPETESAASDETQTELAKATIDAAKVELEALKKQLETLKANPPAALPVAMGAADLPSDEISDSHVHIRGAVRNIGAVVPRGFLQVCGSGDATIRSPRGSGRLDLADWLTDPDHPLVARVFVNRIWMHLFGEGIVRTVDNFGIQGERPTHPELIDALAIDFLRSGWHIKPFIRNLVHTQAYLRSTEYNEKSITIDPENRLLWRAHRRRLPAEAIRDTMLAVSGVLDMRIRPEIMKGHGVLVSSNKSDSTAKIDDVAQPFRTIQLPVVRGYIPALLTSLDVADPDLIVGQRPTTNVPGQPLVLINSKEVNDWARLTAERISQQEGDLYDRLTYACQLCLQRDPTLADHEIAALLFPDEAETIDQWQQFVAAMFAGTEFRLLD